MGKRQAQNTSTDPLKLEMRDVDVGGQSHGEGLIGLGILKRDERQDVRASCVPSIGPVRHGAVGRPRAHLNLGIVGRRENPQFGRKDGQSRE